LLRDSLNNIENYLKHFGDTGKNSLNIYEFPAHPDEHYYSDPISDEKE
jgi:hypothetical protein